LLAAFFLGAGRASAALPTGLPTGFGATGSPPGRDAGGGATGPSGPTQGGFAPQSASCSTASFGAAANYATGTNPWSVAVGDFNRDGNPDLAVASFGSNNVAVRMGDGTGGFGAATNYTVGTGPISVAVGDFNRDGNPDLAVDNYTTNNVS